MEAGGQVDALRLIYKLILHARRDGADAEQLKLLNEAERIIGHALAESGGPTPQGLMRIDIYDLWAIAQQRVEELEAENAQLKAAARP